MAIRDIGKLSAMVQEYSKNLYTLAEKVGISSDAKFIPDGFIGLQRQAIMIESNLEIGDDYVRMAIHGHLPSYMRIAPISDERARLLYVNWKPPHFVPEYHKLINQRREAFDSFLNKGGIVREIINKDSLVRYVKSKVALHDDILDPHQEIEERLSALLYYMKKKNYYVSFLEKEYNFPRFLLKSNVGLVVDIRTSGEEHHFTRSIDGLYSKSEAVMDEFERKFESIWQSPNPSEDKEFIESLLKELKEGR
jgi:hypothetical protein